MNTRQPRNLVIVRAGDQSLHEGWINGPDRNFDLFISYFGNEPDRYLADAEFHENRKGMKWPVLGELLREQPQLLERYDHFWFPDDDLVTSTEVINRMFDYFGAYRLSLAQPALSRDSYFSWELVLQQPDYQLRFTRFVEVMAPIFDRTTLKTCAPTFSESRIGWGLDFVWPRLCGDKPNAIAIIDATPVRHSRPVGGGELYKTHQVSTADTDWQNLVTRYGIPYKYKAEARYFYGGIRQIRRPWYRRLWQSLSQHMRRLDQKRREKRQERWRV